MSGVLLDLDGTLVDSTAVVDKHWALVADHLGLERDEVVGRFHGMTADQTMRTIAPLLAEEDRVSLVSDLLAGELADAGLVTALARSARARPGAAGGRVGRRDQRTTRAGRGAPRGCGAAGPRPDGDGRRRRTWEAAIRSPTSGGSRLSGSSRGSAWRSRTPRPESAPPSRAGCQVLGVRTTHPELEVPTVLDLSWVSVAVDGDVLVLSGRQGL